MNFGRYVIGCALNVVVLCVPFKTVSGEISDSVLRQKLVALRSDGVKWNCAEAMKFLSAHVDEAKVQSALLERLSTKDEQEQEAILLLLFKAKGFKPDNAFMSIVLKRLHHWGRPERMVDGPAGNAGADFLIAHASQFGDLIAAEIRDSFTIKDYSLWVQYAVTRALAKGQVLDRYAAKFSPTFLRNLGDQLKSDDIPNNAELATMTFLFLGKIGVPTLEELAKGSDTQAARIAKLLLEHFAGKLSMRDLNAKLGSAEFIGFDFDDSSPENDLDDCDLKKQVVSPHFFRFRPGAPEE
jgi:hypothetical protein